MKRIEEFSDKELLDELQDRYDDFIMAGRKYIDVPTKKKDEVRVSRMRHWKGDYDVCVGLLFGAAMDSAHKNWGVSSDDVKYDE